VSSLQAGPKSAICLQLTLAIQLSLSLPLSLLFQQRKQKQKKIVFFTGEIEKEWRSFQKEGGVQWETGRSKFKHKSAPSPAVCN
jgi:hypothetical protein